MGILAAPRCPGRRPGVSYDRRRPDQGHQRMGIETEVQRGKGMPSPLPEPEPATAGGPASDRFVPVSIVEVDAEAQAVDWGPPVAIPGRAPPEVGDLRRPLPVEEHPVDARSLGTLQGFRCLLELGYASPELVVRGAGSQQRGRDRRSRERAGAAAEEEHESGRSARSGKFDSQFAPKVALHPPGTLHIPQVTVNLAIASSSIA